MKNLHDEFMKSFQLIKAATYLVDNVLPKLGPDSQRSDIETKLKINQFFELAKNRLNEHLGNWLASTCIKNNPENAEK